MADFTYGADELEYLQHLTRSQNIIFISGGSGVIPITGFIDGATSLGASATWESGMIGNDIENTVNDMAATARNAMGLAETLKSLRSTIQTWQNSTVDAMAFNIIRLAGADGVENPLETVKDAYRYVLPSESAGFGGNLLTTPGGYTVNILGNQTGAISLRIGEWFEAKDSFIVTDLKVEVSKQRVAGTNVPLFAKIDIVLAPIREFTAEEVIEWFKT